MLSHHPDDMLTVQRALSTSAPNKRLDHTQQIPLANDLHIARRHELVAHLEQIGANVLSPRTSSLFVSVHEEKSRLNAYRHQRPERAVGPSTVGQIQLQFLPIRQN